MKHNEGDGIIQVYGSKKDIQGYLVLVRKKNGNWGNVGYLFQTEPEARNYYTTHFGGSLDPDLYEGRAFGKLPKN